MFLCLGHSSPLNKHLYWPDLKGTQNLIEGVFEHGMYGDARHCLAHASGGMQAPVATLAARGETIMTSSAAVSSSPSRPAITVWPSSNHTSRRVQQSLGWGIATRAVCKSSTRRYQCGLLVINKLKADLQSCKHVIFGDNVAIGLSSKPTDRIIGGFIPFENPVKHNSAASGRMNLANLDAHGPQTSQFPDPFEIQTHVNDYKVPLRES
ncbi:hypothetical protein CBL_08228 [Carabus blaptoides fortunei]